MITGDNLRCVCVYASAVTPGPYIYRLDYLSANATFSLAVNDLSLCRLGSVIQRVITLARPR